MPERKKRSYEIVKQLKMKPEAEKALSEAMYPILKKYEIGVESDEVLVFTPVVLDKPQVIFDALDICRMGICPRDWFAVKESVKHMFSIEKLDAFKEILR
jgi:hypothetical protein